MNLTESTGTLWRRPLTDLYTLNGLVPLTLVSTPWQASGPTLCLEDLSQTLGRDSLLVSPTQGSLRLSQSSQWQLGETSEAVDDKWMVCVLEALTEAT